MGCAGCSNNTANGLPPGCKNNGSCGVNGCGVKLHVFDWLANMEFPDEQKEFDCLEVRFKNGRKQFYRNIHNLQCNVGDVVVVEGSPGYDVGVVSVVGELVRLQMNKKGIDHSSDEVKRLYRKATQEDVEKWKNARSREQEALQVARDRANSLELEMKISDVEFQGDNKKVTIFYTADQRVDFRELIKYLADDLKVRIEMKQIGARQEAARIGGIGDCGRELCCSTWLTDFRSVSTSAARYQQLSLNPQKLAGQCGKLKCCLNYELDMYLEAVKDFPNSKTKLETQKGTAFNMKTDIFKRTMWYLYEGEVAGSPVPLSVERVKEIIEMNQKGEKPDDLPEPLAVEEAPKLGDNDLAGQERQDRFDKKKKGKKGKKGDQKGRGGPKGQGKGSGKKAKGRSKSGNK